MKYKLLILGFAATSLALAQDIQPSCEMPPSALAQRATSPEQQKLLVELLQTPALNEANTNNGKTYSVEDIQFIDCKDDSLILVHVNPFSAPHWFLLADSQGHVLCRIDHFDASSVWEVEQVECRGGMLYITYSEQLTGSGRVCEFPLFARPTASFVQIKLGEPPIEPEDEDLLCYPSNEPMEMDCITYSELSPSGQFRLLLEERYRRGSKQRTGYILSLEIIGEQWSKHLLKGCGTCDYMWSTYNGLDILTIKRQHDSLTTSVYIIIIENKGGCCKTVRRYSRRYMAFSNKVDWPEVDEEKGMLIFRYTDLEGEPKCDYLQLNFNTAE